MVETGNGLANDRGLDSQSGASRPLGMDTAEETVVQDGQMGHSYQYASMPHSPPWSGLPINC